MLRAYVVDDEPLARDELKYLLARSREVEILGESDCIEDALHDIPLLKPDIVFLDIELAGENGLHLAAKLEGLNPVPAIVFATAYDEYALQAFDVNAVDYLLKPFSEERIHKMLDKVKKLHLHTKEPGKVDTSNLQCKGKIAVMTEEKIILLTCNDIVFLESYEGKCKIRAVNHLYKVSEALIGLEKKLPRTQFFRVHRSYLVNIDHIVEILPWFNSTYNLRMSDGSEVPVSRTYVKELKQLLGL